MHHVQDCSRVLEVRRGLVVSTVLFPPTSLKYRVIKTLGLCSCGKEKKKEFVVIPNTFRLANLIPFDLGFVSHFLFCT